MTTTLSRSKLRRELRERGELPPVGERLPARPCVIYRLKDEHHEQVIFDWRLFIHWERIDHPLEYEPFALVLGVTPCRTGARVRAVGTKGRCYSAEAILAGERPQGATVLQLDLIDGLPCDWGAYLDRIGRGS